MPAAVATALHLQLAELLNALASHLLSSVAAALLQARCTWAST